MADTTSDNVPKAGWRRYIAMPRNVLAVSAVSLLNDTSSEIIYPLLPAFLALALGTTPFVIGIIEGFAESVASILKLFAGNLSDKLGKRKPLVFIGYAIAAITRPFLGFVASWPQVLIVRMTDRVGKGIRGAPRDALIASSVAKSERGIAFGFNRAADHLGAVFGPVAAFILLSIFAVNAAQPTIAEYQYVFLFASAPVVLGLLIIWFVVREPETKRAISAPLDLKLSGFDPNFKRLMVVVAMFTLSNSTDAFLLLRATDAGISPAVLPLLWMTLHFSKVIFSLLGGSISDRFGRKRTIAAGWAIYGLVYLGFGFVDSAWQCWLLFIIYGTYFGLTEGVEKAFVADLVPEEKRGTAYGIYNLAYGIAVFPASLLFGLVWTEVGAMYAFVMSAGISLLALILLASVKQPEVSH